MDETPPSSLVQLLPRKPCCFHFLFCGSLPGGSRSCPAGSRLEPALCMHGPHVPCCCLPAVFQIPHHLLFEHMMLKNLLFFFAVVGPTFHLLWLPACFGAGLSLNLLSSRQWISYDMRPGRFWVVYELSRHVKPNQVLQRCREKLRPGREILTSSARQR